MIEAIENLIGRSLWENISPEALIVIGILLVLWIITSIIAERKERRNE